jgi:hypothetical protein
MTLLPTSLRQEVKQTMKKIIYAYLKVLLIGGFVLAGCASKDQGITGRIFATGIGTVRDCRQFTTEQDIENCERSNRPSTDPLKGKTTIKVISVKDNKTRSVDSDQQGVYKIDLDAGEYKVCVGSKCSPPLIVKDGEYINYDFVFPRP